MDLSITGDGYIKCVANKDEHIISEQITIINSTNLSLPCMKDRYESNVLFYHIGDSISIFEYLRSKVMDFNSLKELAINLGNVFIKLEEAGLQNQKIITDIRYIFISPTTKQLKVMQCPIEEYVEPSSYQRAIASICGNITSTNAYVAIGYILEEIRQSNFTVRQFVQKLNRLENIQNNTNTQPKQVETRIIEKRVQVNKTSYILVALISVIFEAIGILLLPMVFNMINGMDRTLCNVLSLLVVAVFTTIVFVLMKVFTKSETVQAMQPVNQAVSTPVVNQGAKVARPVVQEMTQKTLTSAQSQPMPAAVGKDEALDKTGILEEEVEINPVKRQQMYSKNAAPIVYLVEEETNKKYQIRKNKFTIGRANDCDLSLNTPVVSKNHAEIVFSNNEYYVRDLKSSNFTYLNKATIEPMELYKIEDGARIGFGNKWFIFKTNI